MDVVNVVYDRQNEERKNQATEMYRLCGVAQSSPQKHIDKRTVRTMMMFGFFAAVTAT